MVLRGIKINYYDLYLWVPNKTVLTQKQIGHFEIKVKQQAKSTELLKEIIIILFLIYFC